MLEGAGGPTLFAASPSAFDGRLAFDPRLARSPKQYGRFLGDLFAKGLLEEGASDTQVTPSFVTRKDKKLRLIFDTRAANGMFAAPPYTSLAGAEALASVHLPPGGRLH